MTSELADTLFDKGSDALDIENYLLALEYFSKSSDLGSASAMNNLGYMHSSGLGTAVDFSISTAWHMKAIEHGDDSSFSNIAINYRCLGDIRQSRKWFEKALCVGDADAALELAKLYMISDKETETVRHYLNIVVNNDQCCESSIEESLELLKGLS